MGLSSANAYTSVTWAQEKEVLGFSSIYQGPDSFSNALTFTIEDTGVDTVYVVEGTLAALVTTTIDLTNLTDSFGDALVFTRAYSTQITSTDATLKFGPGSSNGATWFFADNSDRVLIRDGTSFSYFSDYPYTIDSTHKNLYFENTSATTELTYKIVIIGGQGAGTTTTTTTTATTTSTTTT